MLVHAMAALPDRPLDVLLPDGPGAWRALLPGRRALITAVVTALAGAAVLALGGPVQTFADALGRAVAADPLWVLAAAGFEVVSIAGYVALLWLVSGTGARASYRIALGGTAATRLLPTAGVGGVAFSVWALRRSTGLSTGGAGALFLRFLVLLYAVFLGALGVAGAVAAARGEGLLALVPAVAALVAILLALGFAGAAGALGRGRGRLTRAAAALGQAVREAAPVLRSRDPRLAGALLWWGADVAVLWATFQAVGTPPALPVLVFGYFLGAVGNTLPIPGAASGGMIGALLALGVAADVTLAAVLAYRAIAIWLPTPFGAAALVQVRREEALQVPAPRPMTG